MSFFEISSTCYPKKEIVAICRKCKNVVHSCSWSSYKDLQEKKKRYATYQVCTFCNKTKENGND